MGKWTDEAMRMRPYFQKGAQTLDDVEALEVKGIYSEWEDLVDENHKDHTVEQGFKFVHNRQLYKTAQPEYTFVEQYVPGEVGTESLFTKIDESEVGTIDNPITAQRNMEYIYFKYYLDPEDGLIYLCQHGDAQTEGSIVLQYLPHELVGIYFKVVEG